MKIISFSDDYFKKKKEKRKKKKKQKEKMPLEHPNAQLSSYLDAHKASHY